MSEKEIRIAVAKLCGYENIGLRPRHLTGEYSDDLYSRDNTGAWWKPIPDYLNNLNACAQFESLLDTNELERYYMYLDSVISGRTCFKVSEANHLAVLLASPSQRCEAFLRTKGKWK